MPSRHRTHIHKPYIRETLIKLYHRQTLQYSYKIMHATFSRILCTVHHTPYTIHHILPVLLL
ncbi:hypothetical protein EON63_01660 [archaeon]|nr:MAG: hypothetical protein EON63_01660 [archaeon]